MIELLPLSVGIGLAVGLLFTELFGLSAGGLIVPGYLALHLTDPISVGLTLGVALATFGVVRALSSFLIIYGRRRTALMILIGYILGALVRSWATSSGQDFAVIGFVIPGLMAAWMDRQGLFETLSGLLISSTIVRLILVVAVGTELLR